MESTPIDNPGGENNALLQRLTIGERIQYWRLSRGWRQPQFARQMMAVAAEYEGTGELSSLITQISRWEGNHIVPNEYNRRILALALGVTPADLGMTINPLYRLMRARRANPHAKSFNPTPPPTANSGVNRPRRPRRGTA
jgi:transcriptional regulator with XRE-family HTH domain